MTHRKYRYTREIITILALCVAVIAGRFIVDNGAAIRSALFSGTALIYVCFLTASINLGLVIKIHFRMIVIRYHEKDTNIRLFRQ